MKLSSFCLFVLCSWWHNPKACHVSRRNMYHTEALVPKNTHKPVRADSNKIVLRGCNSILCAQTYFKAHYSMYKYWIILSAIVWLEIHFVPKSEVQRDHSFTLEMYISIQKEEKSPLHINTKNWYPGCFWLNYKTWF